MFRFLRFLIRHIPAWLVIGVTFIAFPMIPQTLHNYAAQMLTRVLNPHADSSLAPMFTSQVHHWDDLINRWATEYDLDHNLLATVMQIESCGHPTVVSPAGAQGLFQVMPFHFESDETMTDPDTNAMRGASFLSQCMGWAEGDPARAMACYNGGPGVLGRDFNSWPDETRRYFLWGLGIYHDAAAGANRSQTLDSWLSAGGSNLCTRASQVTGA